MLQDAGDSCGADLMPEVFQRALNPVVSPARVFRRHADSQFGNPLHNRRSAGAFPRISPLPGDELTVPLHYCVRRDDRGVPKEELSTQVLSLSGQPLPLAIGEPEPFPLVEFP